MKTHNYLHFLALVLLISFTACSSSDNKVTAIKSIEATSDFDLSLYKNKTVYVGDKEYNFEIAGNTIKATPKSKEDIYYAHSIPGLDGGGSSVSITLTNHDEDDNEIIDQSSFDKLLQYDELSWNGLGKYSSHIKDVKLSHRSSFVEFSTKNIPEDAVIQIREKHFNQDKSIYLKPLIKDNHYSFIIKYGMMHTDIVVEYKDKTYTLPIEVFKNRSTKAPGPDLGRLYITFDLVYDTYFTGKEFYLTYINSEQWTGQHLELNKN